MNFLLEGNPVVLDGEALLEWLLTFPEFQKGSWEIIPDYPFDCKGESKWIARVEAPRDYAPADTITTDPESLARLDVKEFQRGDYHHLYVAHVIAFAQVRGVLGEGNYFVYCAW